MRPTLRPPMPCRAGAAFRRRAVAALAAGLAAVLGAAAPARAAQPGEAAPALAVDHWEGGGAVDPAKPDGRTVYVVDFWFADCPPCLDSVPILNRVQERFAAQNVVVVAVNARAGPGDRDTPERIAEYRTKHRLAYRTARDRDGEGPEPRESVSMAAWHTHVPDGQAGFPSAFIVDAAGRVVWEGTPAQGLERMVERVVAGEWTHVQAVQASAAQAELRRGLQADSPAAILQAVRTLAALEPSNPQHFAQWVGVLDHLGDAPGAPAVPAEELDAALDGWYRASRGNLVSFLSLAQRANADDDFARRRPRLAAGALTEAAALARAAGHPRDLLMVALGHVRMGFIDRGVLLLDAAVQAGAGDPLFALNAATLYAATGRFDRALALARDAQPPAEPPEAAELFALHRRYYEQMAALAKEAAPAYTPTAEPPAMPALPALPGLDGGDLIQ